MTCRLTNKSIITKKYVCKLAEALVLTLAFACATEPAGPSVVLGAVVALAFKIPGLFVVIATGVEPYGIRLSAVETSASIPLKDDPVSGCDVLATAPLASQSRGVSGLHEFESDWKQYVPADLLSQNNPWQ